MKLNIGSGHHQIKGFKTVDRRKVVKPDYLVDLEDENCLKDIPDNSVDEIVLSKILEHIHNLDALMKELYRVCVHNAQVVVVVPYWTSIRAANDPGHVRQFTENTMAYFDKDIMGSDLKQIQNEVDFKTEKIHLQAEKEYKGLKPEKLITLAQKYLNVVSLITFVLKVKKDG